MDEPTSQKHTVSILGCGWVGLPLAEVLINQGNRVKASTTSTEKLQLLAARDLEPYLIDIHEPQESDTDFYACHTLIVSVPPSLRKGVAGEDYLQAMKRASQTAKSKVTGRVIMISSTGVYPDVNGEVTEDTAPSESHRSQVLYQAENVWREAYPANHVILRSAGLMGGSRIPGKYFAGKKGLTTGHVPVNYIHKDDIVAILARLAGGKMIPAGTYNAVAPSHPTRKEIYLVNAKQFGFETPEFTDDQSESFKVVSGQKLDQTLNYNYKYPDPSSFSYDPAR